MTEIEKKLSLWRSSLISVLDVAGMHKRNPTAHKWKAPFRSWQLRECVFWRVQDLLEQAVMLHRRNSELGARILLRSAFESVASLIYLNQLQENVLNGVLDFRDFSEKTTRLLLGAKNKSVGPESINIITVLEKCEKKYPGIGELYARLSESSHPSYEGLWRGYAKVDHENHEVMFSNRWSEIYEHEFSHMVELCMNTFEQEYDKTWPKLIENLEKWVSENDVILQSEWELQRSCTKDQ